MPRTRSIRRRLLADHVLVILLLGGAILAATFGGARRAVEALSRGLVERAADQAEGELRRFFDPVTGVLTALRAWEEAGLAGGGDPRAFTDLIAPVAVRLPQVSSVTVADSRGGVASWPDSGATEPDDPRSRSWYKEALARRGESYWTEPYVLPTAGPAMTASLTYDSPAGDGVAGVAVDVLLDDLARYSRGIEISERGRLWILTEDRRLLAWPDDPWLWGDRDPASAWLQSPRELGLTLADDAVEALEASSEDGFGETLRFASGGEDWWVAGRRFELSDQRGLMIAVAVPHADLFADRTRLRNWILALTLAALAAAAARAFVLARRFSQPIEALVGESDRISQGDLEAGRPVVTELTEVRRLADAHEHMRRGLKTLMKLERDLQLARQIQQSTFPQELPGLAGFDLVGWSQPADETGGDSYDVIGLDAGDAITIGEAARAVLMLADATGHGIGPALSVTQLRAMLRMAVRTGRDLRQVAAHMNDQLYADLPGNRFITAWLGELSAERRTVSTFSAGQAPLLLYRAAADEVEVLNADAPPFGLLPRIPIAPPPPVEMRPGDVYVVLSDGFYEAVDAAGMEFGKERLAELLRQYHQASAAEILAALKAAVVEFTGDAPLDDDRTALIIKRT